MNIETNLNTDVSSCQTFPDVLRFYFWIYHNKKRDDSILLNEVLQDVDKITDYIDMRISPENLFEDGELTTAQAQAKYDELMDAYDWLYDQCKHHRIAIRLIN